MTALPSPGSFVPNAGSNSSRGALFEDWLAFTGNIMGGAAPEILTIAAGVIYPTAPQCFVLNEGGADEDYLDSIATITEFAVGQIIRVSQGNAGQKITARTAVGTIVLKTATFRLENGWERLWLEFNGTAWIEVARDYGQSWAQFRAHHQIDGQSPIAGYPSTYSHATGPQALAGVAVDAVMTPSTVAYAMTAAALMIGNRTAVGDRSPADNFLVERAGVLYQMNILTLLAPSFSNYVEGGEIGLSAGNSGGVAHGLGGIPRLLVGYLRCKTSELGYAAGHEVPLTGLVQDATARTISIAAGNPNYIYDIGTQAGAPKVLTHGTGAPAAITPGNWRLFVRAWR